MFKFGYVNNAESFTARAEDISHIGSIYAFPIGTKFAVNMVKYDTFPVAFRALLGIRFFHGADYRE